MGANQNLVQRTVVLSLAMMSALLNGALNALVCMTVHIHFLLLIDFRDSMLTPSHFIHRKTRLLIAFAFLPWYTETDKKC